VADQDSEIVLMKSVESLGAAEVVAHSPRAQIGASWHRSVEAGLRPERFEVPYTDEVDDDGPLVHAARPVLDALVDDLASSSVGVVLTNDDGQLLDRRTPSSSLRALFDRIMLAPGAVYAEHFVGTNAIGTALEQGGPSLVEGHEHFAEKLTAMTCAAHPIVDPRTGQTLGVVDLSCAAEIGSPLMNPLVRRAARDIEHRLLSTEQGKERVLVQRFAEERRQEAGPFVLVSEKTTYASTSARQILGADDEPMLWDHVRSHLDAPYSLKEIALQNGTLAVKSCEPVLNGSDIAGVLVRFDSPSSAPDAPRDPRAAHSTFGWQSLTSTEREVTDLVCRGMTNREVGRCLAMSHYTVDSHLRSIYRKLSVNSRVDLTRVALANEMARST
jgi:sigma-54 dependent transcriptional regulator, acetoin dehydrogenase operon transcriptional activator AcoR